MNIIMRQEQFEETAIDIVTFGGEKWAGGPQIGAALGFADPAKAIRKIYSRSPAEFDDTTNIMVELPSAGGRQLVRLYNARGAALIAMKAQTPKGEAFRRWVLDVLEGSVETGPVEPGTGIPAGVLSTLRHMFIGQKGNTRLLRYRAMGLATGEISRLLDLSPKTVNPRIRAAEYLGLLEVPASLEGQQNKPSFLKMIEARDRAQAAYRARKLLALAAPTGESTDGE